MPHQPLSLNHHASKFIAGATFCFLAAGCCAGAAAAAAAAPLAAAAAASGASRAGAAMYLPTPDRTGAAVADWPGFENQLLFWFSGSSGFPAAACEQTIQKAHNMQTAAETRKPKKRQCWRYHFLQERCVCTCLEAVRNGLAADTTCMWCLLMPTHKPQQHIPHRDKQAAPRLAALVPALLLPAPCPSPHPLALGRGW